MKPFLAETHVVSVPIGIFALPNSRLIHPNTETWYDFRHRYIFLQHVATKCFGKCVIRHKVRVRRLLSKFRSLNNKNIDFAGSFTNYFQICATTPTGFSSICYKTDRILEYVQQNKPHFQICATQSTEFSNMCKFKYMQHNRQDPRVCATMYDC